MIVAKVDITIARGEIPSDKALYWEGRGFVSYKLDEHGPVPAGAERLTDYTRSVMPDYGFAMVKLAP